MAIGVVETPGSPTGMLKRFPADVRNAMVASGAAATCVPVKFDTDDWEAGVFFQLAGAECKPDRRILSKADNPVQIGFEADLIEHANASVVMLRLEVCTVPDDPLIGEILLTIGEHATQFDTLKLLTHQPRLSWFFGDQHYWVIHSQQHALGAEQHRAFDEILRDALKHDALVRMSSHYDARSALAEVVSHYELRAGVVRTEYKTHRGSVPPSGTAAN